MDFLLWILIAVACVVPMVRLLPHFGINKMWACIAVLPVGAVVLLWVMALKLNELEKR